MKETDYITSSTNQLHDDTTIVYELLMDKEYDEALSILTRIMSVARDMRKTFSNEI